MRVLRRHHGHTLRDELTLEFARRDRGENLGRNLPPFPISSG